AGGGGGRGPLGRREGGGGSRGGGRGGGGRRKKGRGRGVGGGAGGASWFPAVVASVVSGGAGLAVTLPADAHRGAAAAGHRMALMQAAAREFGVPAGLLQAVSYGQTRGDRPGGLPRADGGVWAVGPGASTSPPTDGRGDLAQPAPRKVTLPRTHFTLDEAARLLHVRRGTLIASERQNIRGAAAVLAHYARELGRGRLPGSLGGWYGAVAAYSGRPHAAAAPAVAG